MGRLQTTGRMEKADTLRKEILEKELCADIFLSILKGKFGYIHGETKGEKILSKAKS